MLTTSTNEVVEEEARRAYLTSFQLACISKLHFHSTTQALKSTSEVLKYRWPTQPSLGHFTAPGASNEFEPSGLPPVPLENLPRFHGTSQRMCLPALTIQGDTFQQAVDARRSGNGTPGAIGFGLTRDRAASAIPRTQPNDELARLTQTCALETTPMIEGGLDEAEEGVGTVAASAALGAMLSRVKGMAAANNGSEGPSEEELARSFFEECATASDENDAGDAKKLEEEAENQEELPTTVMASVLLAALDTQAALLTDTDADADPSSKRSESSAQKEIAANRESRKAKSQAFLLVSQSAVLRKLQATPPLRDALLALNGSSNHGGAGGWGSSNSSSGKGDGLVAKDLATGANGAGLNEMDWLVFCEAVKDLMKWNESVF